MGYEGDLGKGTYKKNLLSFNWKFLVHTVIHCLSNKNGGWDQCPEDLANLVHSIVNHIKFKYSLFIYNNLLANLKSPSFYMFPRFIQHVINCELKDRIRYVGRKLDISHMKPYVFFVFKRQSKGFSGHIPPLPARMLELIAPGSIAANPAVNEPLPDPAPQQQPLVEPQAVEVAFVPIIPHQSNTPIKENPKEPLLKLFRMSRPQ
jgi:hypothetical protein